jgi:2-methylisocitrate lyase-like PEP mutase family enzyme
LHWGEYLAKANCQGMLAPRKGTLGHSTANEFVQLTPLPVSNMATAGIPEVSDLTRVGVRRVSLGPWSMMAAMPVVGQAAATLAPSKQYGAFLQPDV